MKRFIALFLSFLPALALAGAPDEFARREWTEAQALTRAAPTLVTEGVSLKEAVSVTVILQAAAGQTLSGGGTVDIWLYDFWDGTNGLWAKFPARQITSLSGCAGQRTCVLEAFTVDGPRFRQRFLAAANGVTVSSGTVTMYAHVTVSSRSASR